MTTLFCSVSNKKAILMTILDFMNGCISISLRGFWDLWEASLSSSTCLSTRPNCNCRGGPNYNVLYDKYCTVDSPTVQRIGDKSIKRSIFTRGQSGRLTLCELPITWLKKITFSIFIDLKGHCDSRYADFFTTSLSQQQKSIKKAEEKKLSKLSKQMSIIVLISKNM